MADDDAADLAGAWRAATAELLARTRLTTPSRLPDHTAAAVAGPGSNCRLYLVDHEQRLLRPFPEGGEAFDVDGTPAGSAFTTSACVGEGGWVWCPILDGSERLGVLRLDAAAAPRDDPAVRAEVDRFVALLGHLLAVMSAYGDAFEFIRRTQRLSPAAELVWQMLPPLTYGAENFVVSAILEPVYAVGGDGFDYGVIDSTLQLSILDSTGHSLRAGLTTAVSLSASRAARRAGADLVEQTFAVDRALAGEFGDSRFTTAVFATIDLQTGVARYLNAGHPPPLLLRGGEVVATLDAGRRVPLGLGDPAGPAPEPGEIRLEAGDRLLAYTDGVIDGLDPAGVPLGLARLTELATAHAAEKLPAPETLRRISRDVMAGYDGPPGDDATLLLVEWSGSAARRLLP